MKLGGRSAVLFFAALAGLLAMPQACAASVTGTLTLEGTMTLPSGGSGSLEAFGFVLPEAGDLSAFTLESPLVRLCEWESLYLQVALIRAPATNESACYTLRDVRMSLKPDAGHSGWVGLRADPEGGMEVSGASSMTIEPRANATLAGRESDLSADEDEPFLPWFAYHIREPNLLLSASGSLVHAGGAELKFMGPDVHISSAANETDHATGEAASGAAQRTLRWLVLEYAEGTLTLQTPAPFTVAAKEAGPVTWDGKATFTPRSGVLTTRDATYAAAGERAEIDGRFSASLTPAKDRAKMVLDGDLRSTTLAATTRTPAPGGPLGPSWVALLVLGVSAWGSAAGR